MMVEQKTTHIRSGEKEKGTMCNESPFFPTISSASIDDKPDRVNQLTCPHTIVPEQNM